MDQEQTNIGTEETTAKAPHKGRFREQLSKRIHDRRAVYLLPNMFTMTSMFLGFLAMIWAVQDRVTDACLLLLLSAVMDGLDGKVARLTHSASEFGVQFDSLADLIAFGFAPAFVIWHWQLQTFGRLGVAAAFIYAACGAIRLARFNVNAATEDHRFFMGMPIPTGGCTLVTFIYLTELFPNFLVPSIPYLALVITIGCGLLMVSTVRYFSFKEYGWLKAHPYKTLIAFLILLLLVYSQPKFFGFIYCAAYIASGLIYTLIYLPRRSQQLRTLEPTGKEGA